MSEKRLWYVAKGCEFSDTDADICKAVGSVYRVVAFQASAAQAMVERYLEENPDSSPDDADTFTNSGRVSHFFRIVGNQPVSVFHGNDALSFDKNTESLPLSQVCEAHNVALYDDVTERYVWLSATRNAKNRPLSPVSSFDSFVETFMRYPSRFDDMSVSAINAAEESITVKTRNSIESLFSDKSLSYKSFISRLQGQPYSAGDTCFINHLTDAQQRVVRADTALSEKSYYIFMGLEHTTVGLPSGRAVFDYGFSEIQNDLRIDDRERVNNQDSDDIVYE